MPTVSLHRRSPSMRRPMKPSARPVLLALVISCLPSLLAEDTVQRIYTEPSVQDAGGIKGVCQANITHALAVNHDHLRVYRGQVSADGRAFTFVHLPVGKYDLVCVTKDRAVYEGLALGEDQRANLPAASLANLKKRVEAQDAFFNHARIHRLGFDGADVLLFVERTSDRQILKQNGEPLGADVRRLELLAMSQAADDWQVTGTRHLYREEQPPGGIDFLADIHVPEFASVRVIDSVKDLGSVVLPLR